MEWWSLEWPALIALILRVVGIIFLIVLGLKFFYWFSSTLNGINNKLSTIIEILNRKGKPKQSKKIDKRWD